jgi:hypothetical protein
MQTNHDPHTVDQIEEGFLQVYVPPYMRDEIRGYVLDHRPVGNFLTAILENNFINGVLSADTENKAVLSGWAQLLYNYTPSVCHGSREKVKSWLTSYSVEERKT